MAIRKDHYPSIFISITDTDLPPDFCNDYDKYSDFKLLAKGGKATLHTCLDAGLGRVVVHKSIHPHLADNTRERRRFLREARIAAQIQHPNTIPIYEMGRTPTGNLYFTMKYIAGTDLFTQIQRVKSGDMQAVQEFTLDRMLDILSQACQALANAHAHGVIHRDIKPENILIGQFGEVCLVDWGVAKVWGMPNEVRMPEQGVDSENLNATGHRPGTPLYMSPEQTIGSHYVDQRTDVYSAGVVLYEILCLDVPFMGKDIHSTFDKIVHDQPEKPSRRNPDRHIPSPLEMICLKALSKDPARRQPSISELIGQINEFQQHRTLIS
ncbi:MAG: serine/threonine-protein kinase [Planctomycetota bacterium]|nr:serine/threonine-protein kinase [Planctomycetota bacterium]